MTTLTDLDTALQERAESEWTEKTTEAKKKLSGVVNRTILDILDSQTKQDVLNLIQSDLSGKKGPWIDNRKQVLLDGVIRRL